MASWNLRPLVTAPTVPFPDIVAQTADKNGIVLGQWDGEENIEGIKRLKRDFMVHEDLLKGVWGMDGWRHREEGAK